MPFSTPPLLCNAARFSLRVNSRSLPSTSTAFSKGWKPCSSRGSGGRTRTTTCGKRQDDRTEGAWWQVNAGGRGAGTVLQAAAAELRLAPSLLYSRSSP